MKIIGWQLARLVAEAQASLVGGVIEQIRRAPDRSRLAFTIEVHRQKAHLIVGVRGESTALYWTSRRDTIPAWAQYERTEVFNRLRSVRIIGIGMLPTDRVVRIELEKSSDDETARRFALVLGWIGSQSNIWMLDPETDTILERFHADTHGDGAQVGSKVAKLQLPAPPELSNWIDMSIAQYRALRQSHSDLLFAEFLRRHLWGIDAGLARQIAERRRELAAENAGDDSTPSVSLWQEFQALSEIGHAAISPDTRLTLPEDQCNPESIRLSADSARATASLAELSATCDARQPREGTDSDERGRLYAAIETAIKKTERRLSSLARTLAEAGRAEDYKRQGDLLGANRHLLTKGLAEIRVADWESGGELVIPLNPARSPQQNIDDYYRKSRKAADAIKAARAEQPHLMRERERLRAALQRLDSAIEDPNLTDEIATALGWNMESVGSKKDQTTPRLPYREFMLGKERLWVGRSSRDNDELTLRFARPQDIFFHVHGSPGSHVILKRDSKDGPVEKDTITQAAQIAAFFSRAKHAGLVPVVYAEARFVHKPRKAPAGTVSVEREKPGRGRPPPPPGSPATTPPKCPRRRARFRVLCVYCSA